MTNIYANTHVLVSLSLLGIFGFTLSWKVSKRSVATECRPSRHSTPVHSAKGKSTAAAMTALPVPGETTGEKERGEERREEKKEERDNGGEGEREEERERKIDNRGEERNGWDGHEEGGGEGSVKR